MIIRIVNYNFIATFSKEAYKILLVHSFNGIGYVEKYLRMMYTVSNLYL